MVKFSQPALVQLGDSLKKAGIDSSITDIPHLSDPQGNVARGILAGSVMNLSDAKLGSEQRLDLTPTELTGDVKSISREAIINTGIFGFFGPQSEKFVSSIRNQAGSRQGEILGQMQTNMKRYMITSTSNGTEPDLKTAATDYISEFTKSNNYFKVSNGQFIRIPLQFRGIPLDEKKVTSSLKNFQKAVTQNLVDSSDVRRSKSEGQAIANQRWWNSVGSMNHWVNSGTGESYVLYGADNLPLFWKDSKKAIIVKISDITKRDS